MAIDTVANLLLLMLLMMACVELSCGGSYSLRFARWCSFGKLVGWQSFIQPIGQTTQIRCLLQQLPKRNVQLKALAERLGRLRHQERIKAHFKNDVESLCASSSKPDVFSRISRTT